MCKAIGIPQSTLNEVLKKSTRLLKTTTGTGRGAKTGWTTISLFIQYVLKKATAFAESKGLYRIGLQAVVDEWIGEVEPIAGYNHLINYLQKLDVTTPSPTEEIQRDRSG